ncbi:MAG: hypothetical protein AAGH99_10440 [Planctomycetota bacterium]
MYLLAKTIGIAALGVFLLAPAPSSGQSLQDRIEDRERRLAKAAERDRANQPDLRINEKLARRIDFTVEDVGVRDALANWARQTQVPLVIDWQAMEFDGVDPDREVEVILKNVRADTALLFLMDAMSDDLSFVAETYDWGVQMRSRERANVDVVTRVYDIRDLIVEVPNFTDAPRLSLTDALSNTSSGGAGTPSGSGIFDVEDFSDEDRPLTRRERGELLVDLVRDTIEPDVWRENGGEFSRARYRDGRMIIRAPRYVHAQIGRPAIALD